MYDSQTRLTACRHPLQSPDLYHFRVAHCFHGRQYTPYASGPRANGFSANLTNLNLPRCHPNLPAHMSLSPRSRRSLYKVQRAITRLDQVETATNRQARRPAVAAILRTLSPSKPFLLPTPSARKAESYTWNSGLRQATKPEHHGRSS